MKMLIQKAFNGDSHDQEISLGNAKATTPTSTLNQSEGLNCSYRVPRLFVSQAATEEKGMGITQQVSERYFTRKRHCLVESLHRIGPKMKGVMNTNHNNKHQPRWHGAAVPEATAEAVSVQYWKPIKVIYWLITSHYFGPSSSHYDSAPLNLAPNWLTWITIKIFAFVFDLPPQVFLVRFQLFSRILGTLCKHLESPYLSMTATSRRRISILNSGGEFVEEEPEQEQ